MTKLKRIMATIGPGLLYAGAAVGVSHLVQSTRAGAEFGLQLIGVIIVANLIKYPFFQIGPRYTAATSKNLLQGYAEVSPFAIWLVSALTLATMFIVQAAVTIVTAGLALQIFNIGLDVKTTSLLILGICSIFLLFGRFSLLDSLMKVVVVALSITTILCVVLAASNSSDVSGTVFDFSLPAHVVFLVALVGWMPAPLEIAIWHSLWSQEKNKQLERKVTMKEALFDFNIGFLGTMILAVFFALLGNFVLYGRGIELYPQAGKFAGQLIGMYTEGLGDWSYWMIAIAAFATMFSTTITCLDAFPRVMTSSSFLLYPTLQPSSRRSVHGFWLILTAIGAAVILLFFISNMKAMITLATVLAFLIAPVFAILNYMVMKLDDIPEYARMSRRFEWACRFGIFALTVFSFWFMAVRFF